MRDTGLVSKKGVAAARRRLEPGKPRQQRPATKTVQTAKNERQGAFPRSNGGVAGAFWCLQPFALLLVSTPPAALCAAASVHTRRAHTPRQGCQSSKLLAGAEPDRGRRIGRGLAGMKMCRLARATRTSQIVLRLEHFPARQQR